MSGLFQKKEKLYRELVRWKRELKLAPGYLIPTLWILFTLALLGWALMASFSTIRRIFSNKLLESGFHMENYAKTWVNFNASTILFSSLFYTTVPCTLLILICTPVTYALSCFGFVCDKLMQSSLVTSTGISAVMISLSLLTVVAGLNILNNMSASRAILIFLYTGISVPYTIIFLTTFFASLLRAFEEAAATDGCPPVGTFRLIMLPAAQPGIVVVTIFNFINIRDEYFTSLIFGNSGEVRPVIVDLYFMIGFMRYIGDRVDMFSAAVIAFLPTFILYIFLSEKIIAGVTGGGVKG